jgi:hypothetical protein
VRACVRACESRAARSGASAHAIHCPSAPLVRVRAPLPSPSSPHSSGATPRVRSGALQRASANHSPIARPGAGARAAAAVAVVAAQLRRRPPRARSGALQRASANHSPIAGPGAGARAAAVARNNACVLDLVMPGCSVLELRGVRPDHRGLAVDDELAVGQARGSPQAREEPRFVTHPRVCHKAST